MMLSTRFSELKQGFFRNKVQVILAAIYAAVWVYYAIDPAWRPQWLLDNYLVFFLVVVLTITYRKYPLSDVSYLCIAVFMSLHAVGANHGYSSVDFGYWLSNTFGLERPNVYDRLVHLLFGVLIAYPIHELLKRYSSFRTIWTYILPVDFILSYSALYEIIEAAVAWTLPAQDYDPFVGLQGDIWDGFRDMALALVGAIITMTILSVVGYRKRVAKPGED